MSEPIVLGSYVYRRRRCRDDDDNNICRVDHITLTQKGLRMKLIQISMNVDTFNNDVDEVETEWSISFYLKHDHTNNVESISVDMKDADVRSIMLNQINLLTFVKEQMLGRINACQYFLEIQMALGFSNKKSVDMLNEAYKHYSMLQGLTDDHIQGAEWVNHHEVH